MQFLLIVASVFLKACVKDHEIALRPMHTTGFAPGTCSRLILHCQYTLGVILRELAPCYDTHVGANERNLVWGG